jgi:hypothetical protein
LVERLVAAALVVAERHVADQLTKGLSAAQVGALEALLRPKEGAATRVLAVSHHHWHRGACKVKSLASTGATACSKATDRRTPSRRDSRTSSCSMDSQPS